jgi:hypothetical protein
MSSSSCGAGARPATSSSSTIAAHRVDTIRQAIAGRGRPILHLPPYRPDLNPIEQLCAKLKALFARGRHAHPGDELWQATGCRLGPVSRMANCLNHRSYGAACCESALAPGVGRAARPASRSRCAAGMALCRRRERGRRIEGGAPRRSVQFQGSGSPPNLTKPMPSRNGPVPPAWAGVPHRRGSAPALCPVPGIGQPAQPHENLCAIEIALCRPDERGRRNAQGARAGLPPAARRPGSARRRRTLSLHPDRTSATTPSPSG